MIPRRKWKEKEGVMEKKEKKPRNIFDVFAYIHTYTTF